MYPGCSIFFLFCFVLFCFCFYNEQPGYKANDTLAEVLALVGNLSSCDHQQCACALVSICMFTKFYSVHFFQHIQYYHN